MPRYAITEKAGPFVAAHHNTGVGTVLHLSERQAEHELRLGTLTALDKASAPATPEEPAGERKPRPKKQSADGDQ
ncbi:hypothetical protein [Aestuariivirga sp.]|uniref:hypothetical protein n=1 Tax=Aestuariivirga sp. TaxID=2650926 RepID=UPI00391D97AD